MVREVESVESFKKELENAGDKLVMVDFYATWCGPCRDIAPYIKELSSSPEFADVIFLKVDVDKLQELSEEYEIRGMPTFIYIKSGKKVADLVGADRNKLSEKLKTWK